MVSPEELKDTLRSLGQDPSDEDIAKILRDFDEDKSGDINFEEFLKFLAKKMKNHDPEIEIMQACQVFDVNGDGFISSDELKMVMADLGENLSDAEIADMIKVGDLDGDGRINYAEFAKMMNQ